MHRHITMKEQYTVASANDSAPATSLVEGMIVDANRGQYWVDTPDGVLLCTLRGRLRKQLLYAHSPNLRHKVRRANVQARDPVAVGDRVLYSKYSGTEIKIDGDELLVVSSRDVLAKLAR